MNAIVHSATHSIGDWVSGVWNKLNRTIDTIGYARAAEELRRLGYYKEAENCLRQMRNL